MIYVEDPDFTLYQGDALDVLCELPAESVDCALTSPPFYGLRDYGTGRWEGGDEGCDHSSGRGTNVPQSMNPSVSYPAGAAHRGGNPNACPRCDARRVDNQIGLEATPDEWVARLVAVFREVRRVLKPQGTLWVECGDSYNAYNGNRGASSSISAAADVGRNLPERGLTDSAVKPKDSLGQPWLLAFALRADGWYLRQAIIWHKPNAMPESVRDRCTTAHSYVFLLSKSPRYWFDADAIAEPAEWARWGDQTTPKYNGTDTASGWVQAKSKRELMALADHRYDGLVDQRWKKDGREGNGQRERSSEMRGFDERRDRADGMKNARSVWTIPTSGFAEAHFATWPEALVERIIKAGCPEGMVLDPFLGSGTTALVARRLGRQAIGIELNPDYCKMAARRLQQLSLLA